MPRFQCDGVLVLSTITSREPAPLSGADSQLCLLALKTSMGFQACEMYSCTSLPRDPLLSYPQLRGSMFRQQL